MACVLVVEDNDDVRNMMVVLLRSHSFETMSARNGAEGLERMRQRRPCLVLLDMHMPVMDGWQFRDLQLQDAAIADVPVVCITAMWKPQDVERQLRIPCLGKPVDFPSVLSAVEKACS